MEPKMAQKTESNKKNDLKNSELKQKKARNSHCGCDCIQRFCLAF